MSCNREDLSDKIHDKVILNERIEHTIKVIGEIKQRTDITTPDMDHHNAERIIRDGTMVKFLDIFYRSNNGKSVTPEENAWFIEMASIIKKTIEEEEQDTREQVPLPNDLIIASTDIMNLSMEELLWKGIFIRSLLEANVQVVSDLTKDHIVKCRKYNIQQMEERKITYTFQGKENMQINVCNPKQVCQEQRDLAFAFMHIFDHVRAFLFSKTTDRSVVMYSTLHLKSIEMLRKLGYLVSCNQHRTTITI